ncbi:MAG TPA: hypothetical protein VHN98_12470 [Acidimicrobiales bacterium]|nr:hypothetical protein [Acidimicrobiales bacterium]
MSLGSDTDLTIAERDGVFEWADAYLAGSVATCPGCGLELRPENHYRHPASSHCGADHRTVAAGA